MTEVFERLYEPSPTAVPAPTFAAELRNQLEHAIRASWRTNMTSPTLRTGKICYIEIPATDIAQSADFYHRAFGWQIRRRSDGTTTFDDTVNQVSGTWVLGRRPATEAGLIVYVMVANAKKASEAVVAAGGEIVQPIDPASSEVHLIFRDPAGNLMGIYQQRGLEEAEAQGVR